MVISERVGLLSSVDMFHRGNEGWRETINLLPTLFISLISPNRLLQFSLITQEYSRPRTGILRKSDLITFPTDLQRLCGGCIARRGK